eukprot:m51a1_g10955 putative 3-oxoacyl-(acyl-carrier protein) reductase (269) ;mRNA; r:206459-207559
MAAASSRRFEGRVALVTGGTSGIGEAVVRRLVSEGARVAFTGRRSDEGERLARETGALYVRADHTSPDDCERCVGAVVAAYGELHVVVNNAGTVLIKPLLETSEAEWDLTFDINVKAVWRMSKLAVLQFARNQSGERGCCIVNVASDWALVAAACAGTYCASKSAVVQITKCMALELAERGIRVNAVCPGDTFVKRWMEESRDEVVEPGEGPVDDAEVERRLRENDDLPMRRVADVTEVAAVVAFLACPENSYMSGAAVPVDGANSCK